MKPRVDLKHVRTSEERRDAFVLRPRTRSRPAASSVSLQSAAAKAAALPKARKRRPKQQGGSGRHPQRLTKGAAAEPRDPPSSPIS